MVKNSTIASADNSYTITYSGTSDLGDISHCIDTGTEYTYNFDTDSMTNDDVTLHSLDLNFGHYDDRNWPTEHTIEDMCKKYPALKIQYDKFVEIYNLVKDDYRSGQKKNV